MLEKMTWWTLRFGGREMHLCVSGQGSGGGRREGKERFYSGCRNHYFHTSTGSLRVGNQISALWEAAATAR